MFSSPAAAKLRKGLSTELQFEKDNYEKHEDLAKLPKDWKFVETLGDVNMSIVKDISDRKVSIEWQLVSPFEADMEEEGEEKVEEENMDSTDFTITVESKASPTSTVSTTRGDEGMIFYCSTQKGEGHRFIIGNVKSFTSIAERDSVSSYNGPEFDDLEEKLQEAVDEYLGELGIDNTVFDFIDASAVDKEHREYMRWLESVQKFMEK